MPAIRGLAVAVGEWYAETLRICLVRNMRHMCECYVVTTPEDRAVKEVARSVPGVRTFETRDFTAYGAKFNKGLCIEQCFDFMGRHGWILVHDADVLLPDVLPLGDLRPWNLHGMRRRILEDPAAWRPGLDWGACPHVEDGGVPIGFFQLFHADDPHLRGRPYWYDPSFPHAGGGDAAFLAHWPRAAWSLLPGDCLHLGPVDTNWMGADAEGRDLMAKFVYQNQWRRAMRNHSPEAAERAGELPGRVRVPGFPESTFLLPFERRAAALSPAE